MTYNLIIQATRPGGDLYIDLIVLVPDDFYL